MPKKTTNSNRAGRRGLKVSLYPLTPDEAMRAMLAIKPEDVKRIVGKPKHRKKS
jgi:hypothetical protein